MATERQVDRQRFNPQALAAKITEADELICVIVAEAKLLDYDVPPAIIELASELSCWQRRIQLRAV